MARGDNLQLNVSGLVVLQGPADGESAARGELETKLRVLFADLNDPLVCIRFAGTGIADKTAERLARSPMFRYRVLAQPKVEALRPIPFVADKKLTRRLATLPALIKKARGKNRKALEAEAKTIARQIGTARVKFARLEQERVAKEISEQQRRGKPAIKVFIVKLDVKYRNPPNPQWKWWASVRNDANTIAPGTFTSV